jgi:hypothetical protein
VGVTFTFFIYGRAKFENFYHFGHKLRAFGLIDWSGNSIEIGKTYCILVTSLFASMQHDGTTIAVNTDT